MLRNGIITECQERMECHNWPQTNTKFDDSYNYNSRVLEGNYYGTLKKVTCNFAIREVLERILTS
jgi:hypothetical protein